MTFEFDQITRERKRLACNGCGTVTTHTQVVSFARSGFKQYQWIPIAHRRGDGATRCTYLADARESIWNTNPRRQ